MIRAILRARRPKPPLEAAPGTGERRGDRRPAVSCGPARTDGVFRQAIETGRTRLLITGAVMTLAFAAVGGRLVEVAALADPREPRTQHAVSGERVESERAAIVDRNGVLLAANLETVALSADPHRVLDPAEAAEKLAGVLPALSAERLAGRLSSDAGFVWIHRNLTPKQQAAINRLGIPGLNFHRRESRVYPQGPLLSHVLGFTDVDNRGLAGIEKRFDERLRGRDEPLQLSIDVRMQHALHDELQAAVDTYKAKGGAGIVLDARTGEIAALVSLPDFDPNRPTATPEVARFNRATLGVYELGSTFKIFNTAMALQSGVTDIAGSYDASEPIRAAGYTINDYHAKRRRLSVPEVFIYSSNIGSAKMALEVGPEGQRDFMRALGFLEPLSLEVPESGAPQYPAKWRPINTMTISFGHGLSVTPLHLASGVAAMLNGGVRLSPTLLERDEPPRGTRVVDSAVSETMRKLMRLNTVEGSGGRADVPGYLVGGKTGTAEKPGVSSRGYQHEALISSFVGAFPMTEPKYVVYAVLDEPKGTEETHGYATGGWVAAPAVGRTIARIAPIAGIDPIDESAPAIRRAMAIETPESERKRLASFTETMNTAIRNAAQ